MTTTFWQRWFPEDRETVRQRYIDSKKAQANQPSFTTPIPHHTPPTQPAVQLVSPTEEVTNSAARLNVTPLYLAVLRRDVPLITKLLHHPRTVQRDLHTHCTPNTKSILPFGIRRLPQLPTTPLELAVALDDVEVVQLLMDHGATLHIPPQLSLDQLAARSAAGVCAEDRCGGQEEEEEQADAAVDQRVVGGVGLTNSTNNTTAPADLTVAAAGFTLSRDSANPPAPPTATSNSRVGSVTSQNPSVTTPSVTNPSVTSRTRSTLSVPRGKGQLSALDDLGLGDGFMEDEEVQRTLRWREYEAALLIHANPAIVEALLRYGALLCAAEYWCGFCFVLLCIGVVFALSC